MTARHIFIILILSWTNLHGQPIKDYVLTNIKNIRSIDPSDTDFRDLAPLKQAIGDAQVVMLGEQDHGDAPCFLAKTRIIKYLHEQLDFNIIAFESDFYGITQSWDIHGTESPDSVIQNIFSLWTKCAQCADLFEYVKQKNIIIAGFDCQHFGIYSYKNAKKDYASLMQMLNFNIPADKEVAFWQTFQLVVDGHCKHPPKEEHQQEFFEILSALDSALGQSDINEKSFWVQEIKSFKSSAAHDWKRKSKNRAVRNIRDDQMADNLLWLLREKYPDQKVVVWAHNGHIAKNVKDVYLKKKYTQDTITTIGTNIYAALKNQVYILGFTSYMGKAGRINAKRHYKVAKPTKNSFEQWIYNTGATYAFINFRNYQYPTDSSTWFRMKGHGHYYETNGNWTNIFDGVFYIKEMYPCDKKE